MTLRDRVLTGLAIIAAIGAVVYPLGFRLMSEAEADVRDEPTVRPAVTPQTTAAATPTAMPMPLPATRVPAVDWRAEATGRRGAIGESFAYACSPGGMLGPIWGTDVYTDDTSVCTAGVHRGVITREDGGTVTIIIRPARDAYVGSTRNGVTSEAYGPWEGSYEVVGP